MWCWHPRVQAVLTKFLHPFLCNSSWSQRYGEKYVLPCRQWMDFRQGIHGNVDSDFDTNAPYLHPDCTLNAPRAESWVHLSHFRSLSRVHLALLGAPSRAPKKQTLTWRWESETEVQRRKFCHYIRTEVEIILQTLHNVGTPAQGAYFSFWVHFHRAGFPMPTRVFMVVRLQWQAPRKVA